MCSYWIAKARHSTSTALDIAFVRGTNEPLFECSRRKHGPHGLWKLNGMRRESMRADTRVAASWRVPADEFVPPNQLAVTANPDAIDNIYYIQFISAAFAKRATINNTQIYRISMRCVPFSFSYFHRLSSQGWYYNSTSPSIPTKICLVLGFHCFIGL